MQSIEYCFTAFCGCQSLKISLWTDNRQIYISNQVYVMFAFCIVTIVICIRLGIEWFIYKDYFPLKQRSPILCIMLTFSVGGQIIIYPMLYISNFFTNTIAQNNVKLVFRSLQQGFEFSIYMIYFVRAVRISFAHVVHPSRSKSFSFKIFQKENLLAMLIGLMCIMRAFVVTSDSNLNSSSSKYGATDFSLAVELQVPLSKKSDLDLQIIYLLKLILEAFIWNCILSYCIFLQRKVNHRYSMKGELCFVLAVNLCNSLARILLLNRSLDINYRVSEQTARPILYNFCSYISKYPITQILKIASLSIFLLITIIKPLVSKKVCHSLLPTGRQYGFIKTMRDFLMEEEFLQIFTRYLLEVDKQNENSTNITLLNFWKNMILLKLNEIKTQQEKVDEMKILIFQVQNILFADQKEFIETLKDSIAGLEDSETSSEIVIEKYRKEINEKVDQLQKMALQKLDKIYTTNYIQTKSYQNLKIMTQKYKQINLNMNILNLSLIVDYQNQLC